MAGHLCAPCASLVIRPSGSVIRREHHLRLSELKSCAESAPSPCPVCLVFWASITQHDETRKSAEQHLILESEPDVWETSLRLEIATEFETTGMDLIEEHWLRNLSASATIRIKVTNLKIGNPMWTTRSSDIGYVNRILKQIALPALTLLTVSHSLRRLACRTRAFRPIRNAVHSVEHRTETILITREWRDNCIKYHDRCGQGNPTTMPARVLDIGDGNKKPKIMETQGKVQDRYVALSYAWGDASDTMFKLKIDTRDDLLREIDLFQLALSHQHGIQVARELGYRYIWIDALCAIQDDEDDWIGQAKLVAQIYGNADLTIVAGRSKDARDGFLAPSYTPSIPPAALNYQPASSPVLSSCWVSLPRSNNIGYLSGRGWCFQEALVSRRQIIYGEEQLSFHCREEIRFEGGHFENIGREDTWYGLTTLSNHHQPQRPRDLPQQRYQINARLDPILGRWYTMTSEYSSRGFYHTSENHVALSSTCQVYGRPVGEDMCHGLLWKGRRLEDEDATALEAPAQRRGPSWSWMALIGPIYYGGGNLFSPGSGKWSSNLREPCCTPAYGDGKTWASDPDGWGPDMIDSKLFPDPFSLEINAYIRRVRISQYKDRELPFKTIGSKTVLEHANQIIFLLEADDGGSARLNPPVASDIAARGLFDIEHTAADRPTNMWAMSIIGLEGLLLKKVPNTSNVFERLGVFFIQELTAFYPPEVIDDSGKRSNLIMEKLPMKKITLV
ncbi:uncharacterized protein PAC_18355 [Phialocephala subalpina]|uniref:Heterokaryon incompatibility domain-containing protein n=1 Tax=Phialocephala subalpina TaxID=576137 RepID=A0A1L7XTU7_9HELO|nr:uncharacterized protein PAC_18355 [Phialocephala subalpina]